MSKNKQMEITDFIASCDEAGEEQIEYEQKERVELDRNIIHSLNVEAVIHGENQFGEYVGLVTEESVTFFGGYEAADVKRVVGSKAAPFTIELVRTQVDSKKTEGRKFNKVHAKLL